MTYEEAHTFLEVKQREMTRNRNLYNEQEININGLAILALEKQIPKKPKYESYKSDMPKCPSCGDWIQNNATIQKYCNFCGQAIKWRSDIE